MPQTTGSKILSWLLATAVIGAGAAYIYYVYGPDIAKTIDVIQKGKLRGSLSDDPTLGNKNPFDQALRDKLKSSNVEYANNSNFSYVDIEEEKR